MMGRKPEDKWYYHEGKEAHKIIQQHLSGKKPNLFLSQVKDLQEFMFEVVERQDFDPRCKFNVTLESLMKTYYNETSPNGELYKPRGEYNLIGFVDGRDTGWTRGLEIKTSSQVWSITKFKEAMQRKVYVLAVPTLKEMILVASKRKQEEWEREKPKVFTVPSTNEDRAEAFDWILGGIKIIESGNYSGGLDENGVCNLPFCYYGVNCMFK